MQSKYRKGILLLSLIAALGTGYWMYALNEQEQLWGYWPLLLFVSAWTFIITLWEPRFSQHPKKIKLLGLSTLTGILLSLGFPPLPSTFLMFVGWIPLLIVEKEIADWSDGPAKKEVFKYGFHAFMVWNILTTYWVANTAFAPGIVAAVANSLLMCIPFVLFHQTKKVMGGRFAYLSLIAYWITFEYIHMRWEISWPWLTLGNSFAQYPSWVQWYEFTGTYGGTLWILATNIWLFWMIEETGFKKGPALKQYLVKALLIITIPLIISFGLYFTYQETGEQVEVVVVQPNYEPHYQKFSVPSAEQVKQFIRLAHQQLTENTDYLVFPETSFFRIDSKDILANRHIKGLKQLVDEYPKLKLLTGVSAQNKLLPNEAHSKATRQHIRGRDTIYWEAYNAALQLSSGQEEVPFYIKSKLVPGAEIFPYKNFLPFLKPIIDKLGGTLAGHGTQEKREAFKSEKGIVGPMICYESVYGEYSTGYVHDGANLMVVVTNDGWWANTAGYRQHLRFASLRAIETRRSIARSANTGISAFINQRGDISQPTQYEEEVAIKANLSLNNEITFYVKWGDLIGRLAIFTAIILLLNTIVKGRMAEIG